MHRFLDRVDQSLDSATVSSRPILCGLDGIDRTSINTQAWRISTKVCSVTQPTYQMQDDPIKSEGKDVSRHTNDELVSAYARYLLASTMGIRVPVHIRGGVDAMDCLEEARRYGSTRIESRRRPLENDGHEQQRNKQRRSVLGENGLGSHFGVRSREMASFIGIYLAVSWESSSGGVKQYIVTSPPSTAEVA